MTSLDHSLKIDLEHIHFWMCAIRESQDPIRTLDAFWRGQLQSKVWLIESLRHVLGPNTKPMTVDIYGGWVGTLASLLFQSGLPIDRIRSIDIDPSCEKTAIMINRIENMQERFSAVTSDMCVVPSHANIVINTSCEHITQAQYDQWLSNIAPDCYLVLQSNNYAIDEHVRIADSLDTFISQSKVKDICWTGELKLPLYKRFMIISRL